MHIKALRFARIKRTPRSSAALSPFFRPRGRIQIARRLRHQLIVVAGRTGNRDRDKCRPTRSTPLYTYHVKILYYYMYVCVPRSPSSPAPTAFEKELHRDHRVCARGRAMIGHLITYAFERNHVPVIKSNDCGRCLLACRGVCVCVQAVVVRRSELYIFGRESAPSGRRKKVS